MFSVNVYSEKQTLSGKLSNDNGPEKFLFEVLKRRITSCKVAATTKYSCFNRSSFPSKNYNPHNLQCQKLQMSVFGQKSHLKSDVILTIWCTNIGWLKPNFLNLNAEKPFKPQSAWAHRLKRWKKNNLHCHLDRVHGKCFLLSYGPKLPEYNHQH